MISVVCTSWPPMSNQSRAPFNKVDVVQAINYAVDRDACIKAAAGGYAVQTAPCTPPLKQWLLPEEQWKPYYRVDLDRARALLARAGYPNGFEATLLTIPTLPTMFANAQVIQANLKRIGIDARLRVVDTAQYVARVNDFDFDVVSTVIAQSQSPGNEQREMWGSAAADTPGSRNLMGIKNPAVDTLIDRVVFAGDREELVAATHALDRVLLWNYYVVPPTL